MIRYLLSNSVELFEKIKLVKNNKDIGKCIYSVVNNKSVIQNLYIEQEHRKNNYGKLLLQNTENFILKKNPNLEGFILNAYELPNGNLVNFYKSCGYEINKNQRLIYHDDGIDIITITNMIKKIKN